MWPKNDNEPQWFCAGAILSKVLYIVLYFCVPMEISAFPNIKSRGNGKIGKKGCWQKKGMSRKLANIDLSARHVANMSPTCRRHSQLSAAAAAAAAAATAAAGAAATAAAAVATAAAAPAPAAADATTPAAAAATATATAAATAIAAGLPLPLP